ncbi:MAG: hypothetical protein ACK526_04145 [Planctomyces sp.]|jgi:hypothetical protein
MKWLEDARLIVPEFDFSKCGRITVLQINENSEGATEMGVEFYFCDDDKRTSGLIRFRFKNIFRMNIVFHTKLMWLADFFVSYDETTDEYCAFDEMLGVRWYSHGIEFIGFTKM